MKNLSDIFDKNVTWTEEVIKERPQFFEDLEKQQNPKYLWIGCSDSRVPANQICGMDPGEVFVHRNVANVVSHTDFSCLSVLQYGVEVLNVEHIIVCGHYGCGGVTAALKNESLGLIDNWLCHIKDIHFEHKAQFEKLETLKEQQNLLTELNVKTQVLNVCHTTIVQEAWKKNKNLSVHGWVYELSTGRLKDLGLCIENAEQVQDYYKTKR